MLSDRVLLPCIGIDYEYWLRGRREEEIPVEGGRLLKLEAPHALRGGLDVLAQIPNQVIEAKVRQEVGHLVRIDQPESIAKVPDVLTLDLAFVDRQRHRFERMHWQRLWRHPILKDNDLLPFGNQVWKTEPITLTGHKFI